MAGFEGIPSIEMVDGEKVLHVDGRPFLMLGGEVHNSTASSPAWMGRAWAKAHELGMNTLFVPVTWELVEPEEGTFDFSGVDELLAQARERGGHLVPLWFGAWKNGQCGYAPEWVKAGVARFWRAEPRKGAHKLVLEDFYGMPYTTLSAFCPATLEADSRAFAALMAHLREVDGAEHTVVAVQVENECGLMGAGRDHCDAADVAFAEPVPEGLVASLREGRDTLAGDIAAALAAGADAGSWAEVFGPVAEELFQTYHTARYVGAVAAAGKAEYPLPMLANCWLDKGEAPGLWPTGGPVARAIEVWRQAAPAIDVCCPDIYVPAFCDEAEGFLKAGNPLLIPETATHAYAASRDLWAVGHHHALCFSPFGFEEMGEPFDDSIGLLFGMDTSDPALRTPQDPEAYGMVNRALAALFAQAGGYGEMDAVTSERGAEQRLELGNWALDVRFGEGPGAVLASPASADEAFVVVLNATVVPVSLDGSRPHVDLLACEDGGFKGGAWVRDRRLNGDEVTNLSFEGPTLLRLKALAYA